MKAYRALHLILVSVVVFLFCAPPAYAAPTPQTDDPVQQCREGVGLFSQKKYTEALPLLEAGFNGREKANFANPEDLGYCALVLGVLRSSAGNPNGALEAYQAALQIFRSTQNRKFEGTTLNNLGEVYRAQGQYSQALEYYQQALVIFQEIGNRKGEGTTLNNLGLIYDSQGQYMQALDYFQQALIILREVGDRTSEGTTLNNLGEIYRAQSQYAQALNYYQQALAIAREMNNRTGESTALNNLGGVYCNQSQYAQALDYYQRALDIQQETGDRSGEGTTLSNLGAVYGAQGQRAKALAYFEQALVILREVGDRAGEGTTLNNLGTVYLSQGKYAQALEYFQQALAIRREVGDRVGEGQTLNNLGGSYLAQGQPAQTLDYYQQALAIMREVGDRAGEGTTLNNLGKGYDSMGQSAQALDYFQQALTINREVGDRKGEGMTLSNLGEIYLAQGQSAQALEYYQPALAIAREVGDREGEGAMLSNLGVVYDSQGQSTQALDYFRQALAIQQDVGDRIGEGITLSNLGTVYDSQGQAAQALDYFQQSIGVFEGLRSIAGNDDARASFIAQYAFLYPSATFAAHQLQQDDRAFAFSEQGRARSFLDALTTGSVELSDQPAAELVADEQETYAAWFAAQEALAQVKAQNPPDKALISDQETQLANAEQAHLEAVKAIEARGDELAALVPGRSTVLSLTDIQSLLDDQTTLVSYFVIDDKSGALAFIITRNSFSVVALPDATPTKLKTAVESLTAWPSLQDAHPQPLQDLYKWLVAPIKNQLKTPRVGIIPHLTLHYIPFAALTDGQAYLGEQYQLFDLPSASSLRFIQQHAALAANKGAVVFGNPATKETSLPTLPYAATEAAAVAKTLGVSDYTGTAATELQLREAVGGAAILHLAAHGAYNQHNPLYSTLYLAPDTDGKYDGRLEVHEIFGLNLKGSQLVVLSACETQLGQLSTGDEVVGMTRAFMFAGAPSVMASLWRVDDEATQTLMTAFYRHWREDGMNKAQALQAAEAEVRANPKWQSPYYWAAFVLSGDVGTSSIQPTTVPSLPDDLSPTNIALIAGGGVLLLVCLCCSGLGVFLLVLFIGKRALRHRRDS